MRLIYTIEATAYRTNMEAGMDAGYSLQDEHGSRHGRWLYTAYRVNMEADMDAGYSLQDEHGSRHGRRLQLTG